VPGPQLHPWCVLSNISPHCFPYCVPSLLRMLQICSQ
jgi:hypothetical protein